VIAGALEAAPPEGQLEVVVDVFVQLVEAAGAVIIFIGAVVAVVRFLRALPKRDADAFVPVRLSLGRFLALGLEFQLAGDILRTAIAPNFTELGELAVVAAIRTALNFFLAREIREEQAILADQAPGRSSGPSTGSAP
jgi:uncharacterized membrane protein